MDSRYKMWVELERDDFRNSMHFRKPKEQRDIESYLHPGTLNSSLWVCVEEKTEKWQKKKLDSYVYTQLCRVFYACSGVFMLGLLPDHTYMV